MKPLLSEIIKRVESFERQNKSGLLYEEIETIYDQYDQYLNLQRFEDVLTGITVGVTIDGKAIYYLDDVILAFRCSYENRHQQAHEFD